MMRTSLPTPPMATIQVRIPDEDKKAAEKILESLGLDVTTAVRMYFKRIVMSDGIPFNVRKDLTVNGFTPEFEAEVLAAEKDMEGSVSFENGEDAVKYLDKLIDKKK